MKSKTKKIGTLFTIVLMLATTSCGPNIPTEIKNSVNSNIEIPSAESSKSGAVAGFIIFDQDTDATETSLKVIKDGKLVSSTKLNKNGQYYISGITEGEVSLLFKSKSTSQEIKANIKKGEVLNLKTLDFSSSIGNKPGGSPILNLKISGQVVDSQGQPLENAKVSDVTGGFLTSFINTDAEGKFELTVPSLDEARNIEVSLNNLTTSIAIKPDQVDNVIIPLIANSRVISGQVFETILKDKNVEGLTVSVSGSTASTITGPDGKFTLRGAPLNPLILQISGVEGYVPKSLNITGSQTSEELKLEPIFVQPIGNLIINMVAESTESNFYGTSTNDSISTQFGYLRINTGVDPSPPYFIYSNGFVWLDDLDGTIQIEGTNIVKTFKYPQTPISATSVKSFVSVLESFDVFPYLRNLKSSVQVDNIPSGEYNITISLLNHLTQKSVRVVIPSRDTISTELIELKAARRVETFGEVVGKINFVDGDGNSVSNPGDGLKIAVISSDQLNFTDANGSNTNLDKDFLVKILEGDGQITDASGRVRDLYYDRTTSSDGNYRLVNVPTGTKIIVAAVVENGQINTNYVPVTYTIHNIKSSITNKVPDINMEAK